MEPSTEAAVAGSMRVALVGRSSATAVNRGRWDEVAGEVDLTIVTAARPGEQATDLTDGRWRCARLPAFMTDRQSGFGFSPPHLWRVLRRARPDLIHVEEEPSSLAALECVAVARALGVPLSFFTWQNLALPYAFPFSAGRRLVLRRAHGAIAGTEQAAGVLRGSGFRGRLAVLPQSGVDVQRFAPRRGNVQPPAPFTVAYVGRLVPEKGCGVLLEALSQLGAEWRCVLVGAGPMRAELEHRARQDAIADRLRWAGAVEHGDVALHLNSADVLVLPSLTTARWSEQLGRVLVEAMACGVAVVGSTSGAIPGVIGDAGVVVPEGDARALRQALARLRDDRTLRARLGTRGRERVLREFSRAGVARRTVAFWGEVRRA